MTPQTDYTRLQTLFEQSALPQLLESLSRHQLRNVALALVKHTEPEYAIVFDNVLSMLEIQMEEADFKQFCHELNDQLTISNQSKH